MIDIDFCASSYLAYRYLIDDNKDFNENLKHKNLKNIENKNKILVETSDEIGEKIKLQLKTFENKKCGILLSGGMDSAIVASYMNGGEAYTFKFLNGEFQKEELARAEFFAKKYNLNLHYVNIDWNTVEKFTDMCMFSKCGPVHSIEPQIVQAALQAKDDGVEVMFIGDGSDYVFGGMDRLLSKDWNYEDFINRYISVNPKEVLKNPKDVFYIFEPYKLKNNKIDFISFMENYMTNESYNSYYNAFKTAQLDYFDPYSKLKMKQPLDLKRIRTGEPKYLIRELMKKRYPEIEIPNKNPMPRPVDFYFKNYKGPTNKLFKENIDIDKYTGNQKWQIWCLDKFLNEYEKPL